MQETDERIDEILDKFKEFQDAMKNSFQPSTPVGTNENNSASSIHVNAGGIGVWIAVICCATMLGSMIGIAFWFNGEMAHIAETRNEQNRRMDKLERDVRDMNDYLAAIYVQAPQLKPKEKTE